jgi:hypothetical protein
MISTRLKIGGFFAILAAASVHLLNTGYADWHAGADTAYVMGMLFLFFSREKIDDERVHALKLKALSLAFLSGWVVVGALRFIVYLRTDAGAPWTLSAYDAMFIILTLAFSLFHVWRFQDGRSE